MRGEQNLVVEPVPNSAERLVYRLYDLAALKGDQPRDVLEHDVARLQELDDADEVREEVVPGVVHASHRRVHGEALAGRSARDYVYVRAFEFPRQLLRAQGLDRFALEGNLGVVEPESFRAVLVDIGGEQRLESCLLESFGETACPREEVDECRSLAVACHASGTSRVYLPAQSVARISEERKAIRNGNISRVENKRSVLAHLLVLSRGGYTLSGIAVDK